MAKTTSHRLRPILIVVIATVSVLGCGVDSEIATRYELEKAVWKAEHSRKRAVSNPFSENRGELRAAVAQYEGILADDRFNRFEAEEHGTVTKADIRRLLLKSRIALTELYFADFRGNAGVTYPGWLAGSHDLIFGRRFSVPPMRAMSLYGRTPLDWTESQCAEAFERVATDPFLEASGLVLGDTVLAVPAWIARIQIERGEEGAGDHRRMTEEFYSRVIGAYPDSVLRVKARALRAELYVLEGRFDEALRDVEALLANPYATEKRSELLLSEGGILAHGLNRESEAREVLGKILSEYPRSHAAHDAVLNLAELEARKGRTDEAARMLRQLELDPSAPRETAATAMLFRAHLFEKSGDWAGALQLLWRICGLESSSRAAVVSPLMIVERYAERGDSAAVLSALARAAGFYLGEIAKDDTRLGQPHVLKDYLIECYLAAGRPAMAAQALETHAARWRTDSGCVGLYKSALVYSKLLNDEDAAARVLQKCLDLFPTSRYAWIVRAELAKRPPTSDGPR